MLSAHEHLLVVAHSEELGIYGGNRELKMTSECIIIHNLNVFYFNGDATNSC